MPWLRPGRVPSRAAQAAVARTSEGRRAELPGRTEFRSRAPPAPVPAAREAGHCLCRPRCPPSGPAASQPRARPWCRAPGRPASPGAQCASRSGALSKPRGCLQLRHGAGPARLAPPPRKAAVPDPAGARSPSRSHSTRPPSACLRAVRRYGRARAWRARTMACRHRSTASGPATRRRADPHREPPGAAPASGSGGSSCAVRQAERVGDRAQLPHRRY